MRWVYPVILIALLCIQALLVLQVLALRERNDELAAKFKEVSNRLPQLESQLTTAIAGLQTRLDQNRGVAVPVRAGEAAPTQLQDQLLLAVTYQLEQVVNWVDLVERKLYFLAFPPVDPEEKLQMSEDIQAKTDAIRARYQALANGTTQLRSLLVRSIPPAPPGK